MADIDGLIFDELIDSNRVGSVDNWRYRVLMAIADAGDDGATDNELTDLLRPPGGQNNLRPRRGELVDSGYVIDAGRKRPTPSGSRATVWRLSPADQPTLTPAFTAQDCHLAGQVATAAAGGQALTQMDRQAGERLRARFALIGGRARRAASDLDTPIEVTIDRSGPIGLTLWRSEGDRARFQILARIDATGLYLAARIGTGDSGDTAADARVERFRSELASLPDDVTAAITTMVGAGWSLSSSDTTSQNAVDSAGDWLTGLANDPAAAGYISRTLDPNAVEGTGPAIADELTQLLRQVLPLEAAAEAAMNDPVQALVNGLFWDEGRARSLIALTRRARQLLFAGPPGTGKTLAARILAGALADETRVKLVQFHPTYAYEDFVEGIRPVMENNRNHGSQGPDSANDPPQEATFSGIRYQIRDGVFKQIVDSAVASPSKAETPHFLIIDEINRANLPRVLGELLFALEYRGEENQVELAYSTDGFYVPDNLWLIGTMNTADRSVALLDAAMRRRFKEVRFDVDYAVVHRWHERNTSAELGAEAAERLKRLNAEVIELLDEDRAIGHSFLIRRDLADIGFEVVWNEDLEPVLRDHLLGRADDLPALREAFLGSL